MPKQLNSKLAFINIPSDNPAQSRDFYQQIFGIDLVRSLSDSEGYHAPISNDGIDVNVNSRHGPQETTTAYLAVNNLQQTLDTVKAAGGQVVWGPSDLPIPAGSLDDYKQAVKDVDGLNVDSPNVGRAAVVVDPGGSQVGFVELAQHTQKHFAAGKFQQPIDDNRMKAHDRSREVAKKHQH